MRVMEKQSSLCRTDLGTGNCISTLKEMNTNLRQQTRVYGPSGAVRIALDGSFSAVVPARRALSWQLTDPQHKPVVRERYWVTF